MRDIVVSCNEVGYYQDGAPVGTPSLVTRLVMPPYDERQCTYWFPQAFPRPRSPNVDRVNRLYHGWDVSIERLFFANGEREFIILTSPFLLVINIEILPFPHT